jgi:hypothetical protein
MFERVTFLFMSLKENLLILMKIRLFVSENSKKSGKNLKEKKVIMCQNFTSNWSLS